MKVFIYVEGPSDKLAMEALLRPLIEEKQQEGTGIEFFEAPAGDKKASVLLKVPIRAVNILANDHDAIVAAMPDLYPKNKGFEHATVAQLVQGMQQNFRQALHAKGRKPSRRRSETWRVRGSGRRGHTNEPTGPARQHGAHQLRPGGQTGPAPPDLARQSQEAAAIESVRPVTQPRPSAMVSA